MSNTQNNCHSFKCSKIKSMGSTASNMCSQTYKEPSEPNMLRATRPNKFTNILDYELPFRKISSFPSLYIAGIEFFIDVGGTSHALDSI